MKNLWNWIWEGRLCLRCKLERTRRHFLDDVCTTCWVVEVLKARGGLQ